jgi:hypothetical protein
MIMPPRVRRFVLTAHVISSVGWLGAVLSFLGIALMAWTSPDGQTVRAVLLLMEPIAWYVIFPLSLTSLVTGTIQGLFSPWGLIRHYWVLFKLVIGAVSAYVLLLFNLTTVAPVTSAATDPAMPVDQLRAMAGTPRDHALLALAGLLTATVLALYKPRGLTRYGQRTLAEQRATPRARVKATATAPSTAGPAQPGFGSPVVEYRAGERNGRSTSRLTRGVRMTAFIVGVLIWAALVRVVLGSEGGDGGGGHAPSGPGTGGETPGVSGEQQPGPAPDDGGHRPSPGVPDHGGG